MSGAAQAITTPPAGVTPPAAAPAAVITTPAAADPVAPPIADGNAQITVTPAPGQVAPPAVPKGEDWVNKLSPENQLIVKNKQFADPNAALESYKNLEKLLGVPAERVIKLPDPADPKGMDAVYDRLGRPKKAEDYKFTAPEGQTVDPELSKWAGKTFHEIGLSEAQGSKFMDAYNKLASEAATKVETERTQAAQADEVALKKEWGKAYDQNMNVAKNAARTFGIDGPTIDKLEAAMGYSAVMKLFGNIGSKLGEDSFAKPPGQGGGNDFNALTPEQAQARIKALKSDLEWGKKYAAGDVAAKTEMNRLHLFAYPG